MNKYLLFLTAMLSAAYLPAQDLNSYVTDFPSTVTFQYSCSAWENLWTGCGGDRAKMNMEVPPWMIAGGWHSYFMVDGSGSSICSSSLDMVHNGVIDIKNSSVSTGPYVATSSLAGAEGDCPQPGMSPWRRNYYGIWTAQYVNDPTRGPVSVGFLHAENKQKCINGQVCPGDLDYAFDPNQPCDKDWYPNYNAFICLSWIQNTQATNWGQQYFYDAGPITWPSSGYQIYSGVKVGIGCGGPSSIIWNGNVYVFYTDGSQYNTQSPPEIGRHPGIKVVRAPVSDALNPYAYKAFYDDGSPEGQWNPSLPAGFTKENLANFMTAPGPLASPILSETYWFSFTRFSVAQVRNKNYFLGVSSYKDNADNSRWKTALWYSYDLLHWQGYRVISTADNYDSYTMNYPIFLSSDGWSNTSIDENDFYVLGMNSVIVNVVNKVHVYVPAPPPPPPPPPTCFDAFGRPMDCPVANCLDPYGNSVVCPPDYQGCPQDGSGNYLCPQSMTRQTAGGVASSLDEGSGKAAYVSPNPGHGLFQLTYTLKDYAITQLNVLDVTGRTLQVGVTAMRGPGRYTETVNITGRAKGMYLLELLVNGGKKTFKVIYQ